MRHGSGVASQGLPCSIDANLDGSVSQGHGDCVFPPQGVGSSQVSPAPVVSQVRPVIRLSQDILASGSSQVPPVSGLLQAFPALGCSQALPSSGIVKSQSTSAISVSGSLSGSSQGVPASDILQSHSSASFSQSSAAPCHSQLHPSSGESSSQILSASTSVPLSSLGSSLSSQAPGCSQDSSFPPPPQKSVGFDFSNFQSVSNEDDASSIGDSGSDSPLNEVFKLIWAFHPESIPEPSNPPKGCALEKIYSSKVKEGKSEHRVNLYDRISEVIQDVRNRFQSSLSEGKVSLCPLPHKKKLYLAPDSPDLAGSPEPNVALGRLSAPVSQKRSLSISYDECSRLESLGRHQLENNSFSFWLLSTLLNFIKESGFVPPDPSIFEALIQSFSISLVNSSNIAASIATFLQVKRREGILSHLPPHVQQFQKTQLLSSPLAGQDLFEQETIERVISEVKDDSTTSAQLAISKAVKLPSFSSARFLPKASSGGSGVNVGASTCGSGRGRGSYRGGKSNFVNKRAASPAPQAPPAKSPRGRSPRGRGFRR